MADGKKKITWNDVLQSIFAMPGIAVDRNDFLRRQLKGKSERQIARIIEDGIPVRKVIGDKETERLANSVINNHATIATSISTLSGIPGGLAMAAAIPADILQYYFNVFVVSQKLAYLYGYPDLRDESNKLSETAANVLTLFVGTMSGVDVANQAVKVMSQSLAKEVSKQLPKYALTKTLPYQISKKVAAELGIKLTKSTFSKGISKAIPILGGLVSGAITLATFRPGALKLLKVLQ
jgi:hypothetical protein